MSEGRKESKSKFSNRSFKNITKKLIDTSNLSAVNKLNDQFQQQEDSSNAECSLCGMVFLNDHSLNIHKETFCVGYKENTEIEMNRTISSPLPNSNYKNQYFVQNSVDFDQQPENAILPRKLSVNNDKLDPRETKSILDQLNDYKKKKSVEQSLKDMEDTLIRDTIRDKKLVVTIQNTSFNTSTITPPTSSLINVKNSQISLQNNDPYRELLSEYSEFKKLEKQVLQEIFHYDPAFISFKNENKENNKTNVNNDFLSLFENSEFDDFDADYLDTISFTAPTGPAKGGAGMNNESRKNLLRINEKTIQLERDRQEIQKKLEALRTDTSLPIPVQSNQSLNRILAELRDQQRINEAALNMLSQRLYPDAQQQQQQLQQNLFLNNGIPVESARYNNYPNSQIQTIAPNFFNQDKAHNINHNAGYIDKVNNLLNSYVNADLSQDEIRLMRINYLQSGGSDQIILNKFTELENHARLRSLNQNSVSGNFQNSNQYPLSNQSQVQFQNSYQNPVVQPKDPLTLELDKKIRKVDNDNKRLTAELADLYERYQSLSSAVNNNNFLSQPVSPMKYAVDNSLKKTNDNSLPPINNNRSPVQQSKTNYDSKQYISSQEQVKNLNSQSRSSKLSQSNSDRDSKLQYIPSPKAVPAVSRANEGQNTPRSFRLKDFNQQPYDPVGGFVIFLDFITNLEPSYGCARIITCLHHPKSGLGEPSLLPVVNTEINVDNGKKSTVALVSTKQPVPRCPPQQALTILVELQMALKNSTEVKLKSCGWTKIQLFDSENKLLNGRWKLNLKKLPIQSDSQISSLSSLPDFGSSELHYRLVNLRDSDEQTNAPISPSFANQYNPVLQEKNQLEE